MHRLVIVSALALAGLALASGDVLAERFATLSLTRAPIARLAAGTFVMGSDDADIAYAIALCQSYAHKGVLCDAAAFKDEQPARLVQLPAFAIDRTEVTRQAYLRCAATGVCAPSRVLANVRTGQLFLDKGASFDGTCTMLETERLSRESNEPT